MKKIHIPLTEEELELIRSALYTEMIRMSANGQQEKGDQCFDLRDKLYDYHFTLMTEVPNNENK